MTHALLKDNSIVRIVGERSLDYTYTIVRDITQPLNSENSEIISQDDVVEIDSNTNYLRLRSLHYANKS